MSQNERTVRSLTKRVAWNIAHLRAGQSLTLEKVAQRAGMHWRHVQKIEHGEVNPTLQSLARLAKALRVDAKAFLVTKARASSASKARAAPRRRVVVAKARPALRR